jgi:hypothetical protein
MASPFAQAVPTESVELAMPKIESVPDYFKPGGTQEFIQGIAAYCNAQQLTVDSDEDRDKIRSLAFRVTKTKTGMLKIVDDWAKGERALLKSVNTEAEHFAGEMDKISKATRKPLTDWENYDKERLAAHETALGQVFDACLFVGAPSIEAIQKRMAQLRVLEARDWQEFRDRAKEALEQARPSLAAMLEKAEKDEVERVQIEADRAELARLRAERATLTPQPTEVTPSAFTAVSMMTPEIEEADLFKSRVLTSAEKIEDEICFALIGDDVDLDPDQAMNVVNAIKAGRVPHVQIIY